ncbi:hypothetical protein EJB05_47704, partial [Eragrostis curvula]
MDVDDDYYCDDYYCDDYYDDDISDGESYGDEEWTANDDEPHQLVADKRNRYVVLTEQQIRHRLGQEAAATAEVFSVPVDWALALLRHYRWDPPRLEEDWFSDQDRVRDAVGLGGDPGREGEEEDDEEETNLICGICMEGDKPAAEMASAGCAHRYCHACWRGYVAAAAAEDGGGRGLVALRCPDASCSRAVLRGMVERFFFADADIDGRDAYERALERDYVEARGLWMKPCPAAGCGCAIEIPIEGDGSGADLVCRCGHGFCWRCGGEPHWPASCAAAVGWAGEADAASAEWVLVHTKPCPRCRRPIEHGGGCRALRCADPCGLWFCWRCLGSIDETGWLAHDSCAEVRSPAAATEEELRRAAETLGAFLRYQDLWAANRRAQQLAEHEARLLGLRAGDKVDKGEVVAEAWEEVAEGRRVLGNACAQGQSMVRRRGGASARRRWELFEYQHGETDAVLDRLQQCAQEAATTAAEERELDRLLAVLAQQISVTRCCVDSFARAVEDLHGMPERD